MASGWVASGWVAVPGGRGRGRWLAVAAWPVGCGWVAVAVAGWPWPWPGGRGRLAGWPWPGRGRVAVAGPWPWPVWPATKKSDCAIALVEQRNVQNLSPSFSRLVKHREGIDVVQGRKDFPAELIQSVEVI